MPLRWLAAAAVSVALLSGCKSAPPPRPSAPPTAAAPDRWDRAMCRLGMYPAEMDSRALAWARYDELRARQGGSPSAPATARIMSERDAFDARCASWRAAAADAQ